MGVALMQANVSAITPENASRLRYRTSVHEESIMTLTKTPLLFTDQIKIECLAPLLSHIRKAGSHVTLRIHIIRGTVITDLDSPKLGPPVQNLQKKNGPLGTNFIKINGSLITFLDPPPPRGPKLYYVYNSSLTMLY